MISEQAISYLYNQGIAHVSGGWILSGTNLPLSNTDLLVRTDEHFKILVENRPAIPEQWRAQGYDHIGDIDVVGDVIYVPFGQPDDTKDTQVTARYDATTLRYLDAVVVSQHQNDFVAVDPTTLIAYSMDDFSGNSLDRYDIAHAWRPLTPLPMSVVLHHTQGASISDGAIWISTSDAHNDLYRVSLSTGSVEPIGGPGPGGEEEGIDVTPLASGYIHTIVRVSHPDSLRLVNLDLVRSS
jgi:hypothetical protein